MTAPLTRPELESLLAEADYGFSKVLVTDILRSALAYEQKAAKWDAYVAQNRKAQARWRAAHPDRKPAKTQESLPVNISPSDGPTKVPVVNSRGTPQSGEDADGRQEKPPFG